MYFACQKAQLFGIVPVKHKIFFCFLRSACSHILVS